MATQSPEEILTKLLQNGQVVDPYASVDASKYLPQYSQTPQQQAQQTVDLQYNSQQRALEEAARQAAQENTYQRSVEQRYGKEIDPRLANVYSALGNSLTQDRAATQENYQGAIDKIRGYYDEASQSGAGVNTDILNRLTQSAQQLGLGAALPGATNQLMSDYQFNQGQLASGKAGRSANLATLAAQIFGLDTGRISSAAREGAQQRASAQQEVLTTLGDLLRANQKEQSGYRNQISGLLSDKAIDLRKTLADITDTRSRDSIQAQKDALAEFLSRAGLAQQNFANQAGLAGSMRDREIQQQQFAEQMRQEALNRSARSSGSGKGIDPLTALAKIAAIQGTQSLIAQRGDQKLTGQKALDQLLNSSSQYWQVTKPGKITNIKGSGFTKKTTMSPSTKTSGDKAGPKFRSAVQALIDNSNKEAKALPKSAKDIYGRPARDPYQLALSKIGNAPKGLNKDALRAAVDAYYKGYDVQGQPDDLLGMLLMSYLGG